MKVVKRPDAPVPKEWKKYIEFMEEFVAHIDGHKHERRFLEGLYNQMDEMGEMLNEKGLIRKNKTLDSGEVIEDEMDNHRLDRVIKMAEKGEAILKSVEAYKAVVFPEIEIPEDAEAAGILEKRIFGGGKK